jgi:adenylate cyclase
MAEDCWMEKKEGGFWHSLREHATHWAVGGVLIAATGFAPEEWFARTVEHLHLPENALHLWNAGIDVRVLPISVGVAFIVGDILRRKYREQPTTAPTSEASPEALPLPDRPSIAVLPFANLSGDPEQEYFSDGVADDIITELSRDRALFVIARNSSFTYRGQSIDIKQVGRELGVRYIVEGSVRREAGRIRVTAQLIDAISGSHMWAERYDRALEHVFDVQDEIAAAVATAIVPALGNAEQRRLLRQPPGNLSAWETYQRGLWHLSEVTPEATAEARRLFRKAAELDPGFASARTGLAYTYLRDAAAHGVLPYEQAPALIAAEARKALEIDASDSEAEALLGHALWYSDRDAALVHAERAVSLNRNSPFAHSTKGANLVFLGRYAEGREELRIGLRLNPRDFRSTLALNAIISSYFFERDYVAAIEAAKRCLLEHPSFHPPRTLLVAALGQLGRQAEAAAALKDYEQIAPDVLDARVRHRPPFISPEHQTLIIEGMRKAGWQG